MDKLKQNFQSFEDAFNNFIKSIGGELVSKLIPSSGNKPNNADYLFRKENILVELKGLEKDHYYKNESDFNNFNNRIHNSLEKGYITEVEVKEWFNDLENPSKNIFNILITLLSRTIEDDIRKAKRQIVESRKFFQINEAAGLIFFANQGNYFPPRIHVGIIKELIMKKYSSEIDGFVYFTTGRISESALVKGKANLWLQYDWIENEKKQEKISNFICKIGEEWTKFVCKHIGGKANYLDFGSKDEFDEKVSSVKFVR